MSYTVYDNEAAVSVDYDEDNKVIILVMMVLLLMLPHLMVMMVYLIVPSVSMVHPMHLSFIYTYVLSLSK
jgi:hypothetical protein